MATKKQIIYPIVALLVCMIGAGALISMKKPPEEKEKDDVTPVVNVNEVLMEPMQLSVSSYGIVQAKYETRLVAQVNGEVVSLSEEFVRGGLVKKGQVLAQIDPNDYEASVIEADANLASARASLELERAAGHVAKEEWRRIDQTKPSDLSLRKPQLAQELARVRAAEAALKRANRNLERTKIIAPYDALIEGREIGLGSYVSPGSEIGNLLAVDVAEVRLPIADKELPFLINEGENTSVDLVVDRNGSKATWSAKIVRNEGVVDSRSRMNYLVAEIKDPYGIEDDKLPLKFGDYVTASIDGISLTSAAKVPSHLVSDSKIAVLNSDSKLEFKTVDVVRRDGRDVIIVGGLDSGDNIITSALDYPVSGMTLALPSSLTPTETDEEAPSQLALKE